jgi:hypothetical protein
VGGGSSSVRAAAFAASRAVGVACDSGQDPLPDGIDPVAVASMSDNIPDGWRTAGPYRAQLVALGVVPWAEADTTWPTMTGKTVFRRSA